MNVITIMSNDYVEAKIEYKIFNFTNDLKNNNITRNPYIVKHNAK